MGCFSSKGNFQSPQTNDVQQVTNQEQSEIDTTITEDPPVLDDDQKKLLRKSWFILQNDISKVGTVTFIRLFDSHPDVQNSFMPFRGLSNKDMESSAILRSHALRVMATVEKCISRLDRPDKSALILTELGQRHSDYQVKPEYIPLMGPQFVLSIRPHLEEVWSSDMEMAWLTLFQLMSYYMRQGLYRS